MMAPNRRATLRSPWIDTNRSVKSLPPFLAVAAALGLSQCGEKTAPAEKTEHTPKVSAERPKAGPAFEHDFSKALAKAREEGKPVIAIFSAAWCGPCQTMKNDVYPSGAVKPYHDKFVWAYLDADSPGNQASMKEFGASGIPHIEFLDSAGKSIGKQVGSSPAENFAKRLEEMLGKASGAKTAKAGS